MRQFLLRLAPAENLTRRQALLGLPWLTRNGLASQVMETLTIGPFLVAYALIFDASNLVIGILAALPFLTQFMQLPAILLIEKVRQRRLTSWIFAAVSRPMKLVMAAAAFVTSPTLALTLITIGLTLRYALGAVVACGFNSWIRDLVPDDVMGRYFARRLMYATAISIPLSLGAALFVDNWKVWWPEGQAYAYSILLVIAFLGGAYSVYLMGKIPEPKMPPLGEALKLRQQLAAPFRDDNFRRLIMFLGSWNFAVNLAAPFFAVYLFKRLEFSLTMVTALTLLSQVANILVLRQWGAIADRFSNKSVLKVSAPLFIICIFAWTFTTLPEKHALTVPLLIVIHIFLGVATAGVSLSTGTMTLKLAPKGRAASYLVATSLVNSMAAGIAPVVGGLTVDFFINQELALMVEWSGRGADVVIEALNFKHWDFFFLFAALVGAYSIHRLAMVEETGEVEERIIIDEILIATRQSVKNLSSVAGLRALTEFPIEMLRRELRKRKRRKAPVEHAAKAPSPGS
jgi:MFS family permease